MKNLFQKAIDFATTLNYEHHDAPLKLIEYIIENIKPNHNEDMLEMVDHLSDSTKMTLTKEDVAKLKDINIGLCSNCYHQIDTAGYKHCVLAKTNCIYKPTDEFVEEINKKLEGK